MIRLFHEKILQFLSGIAINVTTVKTWGTKTLEIYTKIGNEDKLLKLDMDDKLNNRGLEKVNKFIKFLETKNINYECILPIIDGILTYDLDSNLVHITQICNYHIYPSWVMLKALKYYINKIK